MHQYIGKRLGAYQLLEQIGQGGMATIFKAYQPSMDRYVAVKVLPSHFTQDETFLARFTQEARTLARLEHPHILPVHDYGEQEGITYLVMRYIEAGTLKDLLVRQGALELHEAARILDQVGRALGYAHSLGVVHRDIKPSNVLIDPRGDVFLTDFGIAKLVAGTAQFTATGAIVGTPAYMSPEQGLAKPVDHRSDIYALGVVLYEMVTGQVPFEAETPLAVLLKHVNDPLPLPRRINQDLPEAVERVILRAMAKSPDDRFQSAEEMVDAFLKAVSGAPTEIRSMQPPADAVDAAAPAATIGAPRASKPAVSAPPSISRLKALPWLPILGGVAALMVVLIAALLILPNLGGGEADATPTGVAQATPTVGQAFAQATTTSSVTAESTPAVGQVAVTPQAAPATPAQVAYPPGWTSYSNANFVSALVRQESYLWVGGEGGLVRWNLEDGSYTRFGIREGLISGRVNDLLVDEDGILWVATDMGIGRFDGQSWIIFDETDGLDTQWVQTLALDDEGGLWAGTLYGDRGLNYYDGAAWGAPPIPPLPVEFPSVRTLLVDEEIGLLVGLDWSGLAQFDGVEWSLISSEDGLPSDQVYDLLLIDEDTLLASSDVGVVWFDLASGDWETLPQLEYTGVYAMHYASDGSLWFAGDGGATRYDPEIGDWQRFESRPDTIPSWAATAILEDERGLWLGTYDGGAVFFDGARWETWATDDALGGNSVLAIQEDGTGAIWFVHLDGNGLSRYNPADDTWQSFGEAEGALDWPSSPGVDSEGHLWIGGYGELLRYDGRSWQRSTPSELADVSIYAMEFGPNDVLWMVTDSGVMRHDPTTGEWTMFTAADHPVLDDVSAGIVTRDGAAWFGGPEGLVRYSGVGWSTPIGSGAPKEWIDDMAEAPDGSLWVVANGELYQFDQGQWNRFGWPGEDWIERVAVGPDGTVWAGYNGLGRFDPASGDWRLFSTADGLIHPEVRAIHVTRDGVVWIGTEGGISRYVPEE